MYIVAINGGTGFWFRKAPGEKIQGGSPLGSANHADWPGRGPRGHLNRAVRFVSGCDFL